MDKTNKNNEPADVFWNWFQANSSKYYYLNQLNDPQKKEALLNAFLEQLHNYSNKLYFEIGGAPNDIQELIISAEGNQDYFETVQELVSKAPRMADWRIRAFKPAMGVDFVTEFNGVRLDPRDAWFLPLENKYDPKTFGLRIYLPNYNPNKGKILLNGCYQLLDAILGEKSAALDIHYLEVDSLPSNPPENGLIELIDLPKYIVWRKNNL